MTSAGVYLHLLSLPQGLGRRIAHSDVPLVAVNAPPSRATLRRPCTSVNSFV
ncbi:hypothetical protein K523DRAFT_325408 [Schizophyllum commune Tattone D]|nr:hypothetical protein K523DRAFT_325408 [Schizophyllum commune Tattone D]